MFNNDRLHELNFHYLSTLKEMALANIQMAQIRFGLSETFTKMIANSSFHQLEQIAKQDRIYFNFLPSERVLSCLMENPDDEVLRISLLVSNNYIDEEEV